MITTLSGSDGAKVVIAHQGAQVISWQHARFGEQLFLSGSSPLNTGKAVRGGVPVIFPQFAELGPLPKHGFARTEIWQPVATARTDQARFILVQNPVTLALWPHAFEIELLVTLTQNALKIEFLVHNTGTTPYLFTAALHTYLRAAEINQVKITGLQGVNYLDSITGQECVEQEAGLRIEGQLDRIYHHAPDELRLDHGQGALLISKQGFADSVIWNPGAQLGASLTDLEPAGFERMICIEPAMITEPILLPPAASWHASQTLTILTD